MPPTNSNNNRGNNRELQRAPRAGWPSRDRYHHLLVEFRRIPPPALQQLPGSSPSACSDNRHSVPPTREEEQAKPIRRDVGAISISEKPCPKTPSRTLCVERFPTNVIPILMQLFHHLASKCNRPRPAPSKSDLVIIISCVRELQYIITRFAGQIVYHNFPEAILPDRIEWTVANIHNTAADCSQK